MKVHSKRFAIAITGLAVVSMAMATWSGAARAAGTHASAQKHAAKSTAKACKKPTAKGSVIYSDIQFPGTLNLWQDNSVVVLETADELLLSLFGFDSKGKEFAQMATKIPSIKNGGISKDGKTYTIHMRPDLYWSNGKQVVSADAKFGAQVELNKASGPYCLNSCDVISRVDTPNKLTIVYHLKHVYAPFLSGPQIPDIFPHVWPGQWASGDAAAAANKIFNDSTFTWEDSSYPTDGPYQVSSFVKDQRVTLKPMSHYKAFTCGALLKSLTFIPYSDTAGMIADAANHKTDITNDYSFADLTSLHQNSGKFKTLIAPAFFFEHIEFNMDKTFNGSANIVANKNVRQAFALTLNRAAEAASANGISLSDAKKVAMNQILVNAPAFHFKQPFADPKITGAWDPLANNKKGAYVAPGSSKAISDAKKLIAKSPCSGGCTILFRSTGSAFRNADEAAVAAMMLPLGIKLDYQPVHNPPFYSSYGHGGTLQTGNYQAADIALVGNPDPSGYYGNIDPKRCSRVTKNDADQNSTCANDSLIGKALKNAQNTVDPKVRQKWYNAWQEDMIKNSYWIPEYMRENIGTSDGHVTPVSNNPTAAGLFWNSYRWKLTK